MKTVANVVKEAWRKAFDVITIAPTRIYDISKDYRTGKLKIKPKERIMTTRLSTNYLEYDTRTV